MISQGHGGDSDCCRAFRGKDKEPYSIREQHLGSCNAHDQVRIPERHSMWHAEIYDSGQKASRNYVDAQLLTIDAVGVSLFGLLCFGIDLRKNSIAAATPRTLAQMQRSSHSFSTERYPGKITTAHWRLDHGILPCLGL